MVNISDPLTSIDQAIELLNATKLMIGLVPDEDIPLEYWKYFSKLEAGCGYYGWPTIEEEHITIQQPGKLTKLSFPSIPDIMIGVAYGVVNSAKATYENNKLIDEVESFVLPPEKEAYNEPWSLGS